MPGQSTGTGETQAKHLLKSVARAMDVLHCFTPQKPEWGISELARHLGVKKSPVHRILKTFLEYEFVRQIESREYALGPKLAYLSNVYRQHLDLIEVAQPFLNKLSETTSKTCHLAKLHEDEVVYLLTARPRESYRFLSYPTLRSPVYYTALGKVLLAHLPEDERELIIRKIRFERKTPNTIMGASRLRRHLRDVALQGYAIERGEGDITRRCVAAPIRNSSGQVEAAISLAGHASDLNNKVLPLYIRSVCDVARRISRKLGFHEAETAE